MAEYSGLDPVNPLVAHRGVMLFDAGTDTMQGALGMPAGSGLLWAFSCGTNAGEPVGQFSAGAGFTSRGPGSGLWASAGEVFGLAEDLIATDAGAIDPTWGVGTLVHFANGAAVFRQPDAG